MMDLAGRRSGLMAIRREGEGEGRRGEREGAAVEVGVESTEWPSPLGNKVRWRDCY